MKPPAFWAGSAGPAGRLAQALLSPLSAIQAAATAQRVAKPGARVDAAVICIGNLTVGGTGKTPVAAAVMDRLAARDVTVHGLSRGYGGRLKGPERVDLSRHRPDDTGDEPLLLARHAPVWISRDRGAGALRAVAAGAEAVVMDDGFQNPALYKDLSLVVVDGETGWGNGRVFPAGPLREPVAAGLRRADAVVVMMPGPEDMPEFEALGLADLEMPVLRAWLEPAEPPPPGPLVVFAGIGRPEKFFDAIRRQGGDVAGSVSFPDHHRFKPLELDRLEDLAGTDATLVTTEKDAVRLPADFLSDVFVSRVTARFADEGALDAILQAGLDAAAARGVKAAAR
ncbi:MULTISPECIES: tetraacyldisaccharide 4'-kinase [Hyphobacterium]|uniref:Tetraacyldisaccharide 4'-kinase n=1 Tax=Hyphobacterium vulgare TaxID=1736751 RepID=A0ABV6ZYT1_9PROT